MTDLAQALDDLQAAAQRLRAAETEREDAMRARDDALRAAQGAGATYVVMQEVGGISAMTITKALRRQ